MIIEDITASELFHIPDIQDYEYQLAVQAVPRLLKSDNITNIERQCIWYKYHDGMTIYDIAAALGVTPSTVSKHLRRVYRVFRETFAIFFPRFRDGLHIAEKSRVDFLRNDNRGQIYAR